MCDPGAAGRRVSLRGFDLPWREALDLLLERAGCEAEPAGQRTLQVHHPPRVTTSARGWTVTPR